jgi:hypothetical protein
VNVLKLKKLLAFDHDVDPDEKEKLIVDHSFKCTINKKELILFKLIHFFFN